MALDPNIKALMTTDVSWERKTGVDKHGQDVWAAAVTLKCLVDGGVGTGSGGRMIQRRDGTDYLSTQSLWFDANDANVQLFQLGDRFTAVGIGGGMAKEAQGITAFYGIGPSLGDPNMDPWAVEVAL